MIVDHVDILVNLDSISILLSLKVVAQINAPKEIRFGAQPIVEHLIEDDDPLRHL